MPKLYVTPDRQPNAFATGRNPDHAAVAVTQGILEVLDWDELRGVLAHEISHVGNRDILIGSVAAAVALGITFVARMLLWPPSSVGGGTTSGGNPIALLALAILAPMAAGLLQMALSRSAGVRGRPHRRPADRRRRAAGPGPAQARARGQADPDERRPGPGPGLHRQPAHGRKVQFANLFRTHPPVEDRVARLRASGRGPLVAEVLELEGEPKSAPAGRP